MTLFYWQGYSKNQRGAIEASTLTFARIQLRYEGIRVKKIYRKPWLDRYRLRHTDITQLTHRLSIFIHAGIPIVSALSLLKKNTHHPLLTLLIKKISSTIEQGHSLSDALKRYPHYFDSLFCHLIQAGEFSGNLQEMLARIVYHREKTEALNKKLRKALTYPIAVTVVAILVSFILMMTVIPQFEKLFENTGKSLPFLTRWVIQLSHFFSHEGIAFMSLFTFFFFILWKERKRRSIKKHLDFYSLKLPLLGMLIKKNIISRLCFTLAITLNSGIPLLQSLEIVSKVSGNLYYEQAILRLHQAIKSGLSLSQALQREPLFFPLMYQLIQTGEETGTLNIMMTKLAHLYEEDVNAAFEKLHHLLEPFIMSILGIFVGGLVIALYLPIFKLGTAI